MIFFIITYMYTHYEKDIINFQDFTSQKANIKQSLNTFPHTQTCTKMYYASFNSFDFITSAKLAGRDQRLELP